MFRRLFPDLPASLAALSEEALGELLAAFRSISAQLRAGEIDLRDALGASDEVSDEDLSAEAMAQWQAAAEVVREIRSIQASREEARAEFAAQADELHSEFETEETQEVAAETEAGEVVEGETTVEETETLAAAEGETEETETVAAEVEETEVEAPAVETVTAGATPAPRPVLYPSVGARHAVPAETETGERILPLVAAAGHSNARIREGDLFNRDSYADALIRVARSRGAVTKTPNGSRERILVASAKFEYDEAARLHSGDAEGNLRKIAEATGNIFLGDLAARARERALAAAGGICAPPVPFYNVPTYGTTARPVRDFLPSFQADRGGVSIPGVTSVADVMDGGTAITVIEAADDALGGTYATKSCAAMDCPDWTDVFVGVIAHCRQFGNLNARTWPEGVARENDNTMVALARTADGRLLDRIDALSLALTGLATYGASSTLLYNLTLSRVGMISRLRLDRNTRIQAILPFWAADMFAMDLMHGQYARFETPAGRVAALLRDYGIDVGFHLDEGIDPAADVEVWPAEVSGGSINDWPGSTVVARTFLPGTFLHLDGGELELGIVRDSTLNETNDYELFGEIFENVGRVGPAQAAHRIEMTVCPDGRVAAPETTEFTCSAS